MNEIYILESWLTTDNRTFYICTIPLPANQFCLIDKTYFSRKEWDNQGGE